MKTAKPKCTKGDSHSVDTWKMAEVIVNRKMSIINMTKALACAVRDLKKLKKKK